MTTLHDAVEIDRTQPGWLRRAWEAGLERAHHPGRVNRFLLEADIPETLEPFISAEPAPGVEEGNTRILDFENLDSSAAAALLAALPEHALEQDYSGYAPPAGITLRAVADNPGTIVAGGTVYSPELPGEAVRVRELTILDPTLAAAEPDVAPAELPDWLEELPAQDYTEYLDTRRWCLDHGTMRQAWVTAVRRYGITEARRFPHMRILSDADAGTRGMWFAW